MLVYQRVYTSIFEVLLCCQEAGSGNVWPTWQLGAAQVFLQRLVCSVSRHGVQGRSISEAWRGVPNQVKWVARSSIQFIPSINVESFAWTRKQSFRATWCCLWIFHDAILPAVPISNLSETYLAHVANPCPNIACRPKNWLALASSLRKGRVPQFSDRWSGMMAGFGFPHETCGQQGGTASKLSNICACQLLQHGSTHLEGGNVEQYAGICYDLLWSAGSLEFLPLSLLAGLLYWKLPTRLGPSEFGCSIDLPLCPTWRPTSQSPHGWQPRTIPPSSSCCCSSPFRCISGRSSKNAEP